MSDVRCVLQCVIWGVLRQKVSWYRGRREMDWEDRRGRGTGADFVLCLERRRERALLLWQGSICSHPRISFGHTQGVGAGSQEGARALT